MACSFAPHNINEVMDAITYLTENPEVEIKDLLQFVKGPDFPTGGTIINKDELTTAYLTGKGRARIRAEYVIESKAGKDSIVFTSIPYKVSKIDLIAEIDKLCEEKKLEGITEIYDDSPKGGVRLVVELAKGISAEPIIAKLFKMTRLEDTYSFNQVALVDKKPQLLNLKQLLQIYIDHQKDVLLRKTKFEADKVSAKIHILEGLLKALEDIDNIIALIKKSESATAAKTALMEKYGFSEAQAKAILDMKLSKLAKLEKVEIEKDLAELNQEFAKLNAILQNPIPEMLNIFKDIKNKYGDERRTTITQVSTTKEDKEIEFVEPEKCVVIMTEGGLIKRVPSASFRTQKRNGKGVKTQDDITNAVIRTNTIDSLMIFSNKGRMYRLLVNDIPVGTNSTNGQSVKSLIAMEADEEPAVMYSIYRDTDAQFVLFVTKNGLVKKTTLDEYVKTKKKTGIAAITIKEGDELAAVSLIKDEPLVLVTANGMSIKFDSKEIAPTSRTTSGVKGITLNKDDSIIAALPVRNSNDYLAVFVSSGLCKKFKLSELPLQKRAGKGLLCYKPTDITGNVVSAVLVDDTDNILVLGDKSSICVSAQEIPLLSRTSIGNQVIKNSKINSVSKV